MKPRMPRPSQRTVTLPKNMYAGIERFVEERPDYFHGVSEFVQHAVREYSERMREDTLIKKRLQKVQV
jgi:Arc/MetJ-type ribon-helix-helix transcriptional regulator